MNKKLIGVCLLTIFLFTGCAASEGTSIKDTYIVELETERDSLQAKLEENMEQHEALKVEVNDLKKQIPDTSDEMKLVGSINFLDQETLVDTSVYNSTGFEIDRFIVDNEGFLKYKVLKTNDEFSEEVASQFSLSANEKEIVFKGIVYEGVDGAPIVEYIGGSNGELRAKYMKGAITISSKKGLKGIFERLDVNVEIGYVEE